MTTIAALNVPAPPVSLPVPKTAAPATDGVHSAGVPNQSATTQRGGVYTAEYLKSDAFFSSPEQRARVEKGIARLNELYDRPGKAHTLQSAGDAADHGKTLTGLLESAVNSVNDARDFLNPKFLDQIRANGGEEPAAKVQELNAEHVAKRQNFLSRLEGEIGSKFAVSGALVQRHDDGSVSLGAYALSFSGAGFGVRVGSNGSTFTAGGDGPYRPHDPDPGPDGLLRPAAQNGAGSSTPRALPADLLA